MHSFPRVSFSITYILFSVFIVSGICAQDYQVYWQQPEYILSPDDSLFLEQLEHDTFQWFWEKAHGSTGLNPDRSTETSSENNLISIASVGFGLTAYGIGAEREYVTREQAAQRVDMALRALLRGTMARDAQGTIGYRGWYYHFLDANTLSRAWNSELSSIDTALLLLGVVFVRNYFDNPENTLETAIRDSATVILNRVDWRFMRNPNNNGISAGWNPESGYINWEYRGYNEALFLYLLAVGAEVNPLSASSYLYWKGSYRYESTGYFEHPFITFAPLFGHQYPHVWYDFRGIYNDELKILGDKYDYFENARRATYANRAYAIANPRSWPNYAENDWGLTACDGPKNFGFNGYRARGASAPGVVDDGTIAPTAAGGSIAYAPEIVIPALRYMKEKYGAKLYTKYGFRDAYNDSVNWFDTDYIGIDQGPIIAMIENYRSGLVWETMKKDPVIKNGLLKAGFTGGWLDEGSAVQNAMLLDFDYKLMNYPNPFNASTIIHFEIPKTQHVTIEIFNTKGRKVASIVKGEMTAGQHVVQWHVPALASGVYWVRMQTSSSVLSQKMLYLK
ncbi:MAG: T9SS type A sorting domain-containing protein [Deferribacteres bacterium]|nr:T9SS type A sorting domain-containing protein [Deferribacteres bacterium]